MTKIVKKLWNEFDKVLKENGYECYPHNDRDLGIGTTTCKNDKFVPLINLHI